MAAASGPSDGNSRRFQGDSTTGDAEDVTRHDPTGRSDVRTDATRRDTVPPAGAGTGDATRADTRRRDPGESGRDTDATTAWIHVPSVVTERYEVVRPLRAGGETLVVQHVRDRRDGSEWVVKLYRGSLRRNTPVMTALKEADHPHVVRVRDFGSEQDDHGTDWPWEVLEYVPGGSLDTLLRERGALDEDDVRTVLSQTAEALHYLHTELHIGDRRGAAHRDVKPANILLRHADGPIEVALADFGLVAETRETRQTDLAAGSWMYQAPETFYRADRRVAQDWWSLGILVVRMLTGRNPNDGGAGSWSGPQALFEHLTTHGVDLSGVENQRWRLLCAGLLTRAPEDRWGHEQVRIWLNGGSPEVHNAPPPQSGKPLRVGGETYPDRESLAEAMGEAGWPVARSPFLSTEWLGSLRTWLEKEFNGGGVPGELVEHPAEDVRDAAVRAAAFRAAVLKEAPPRFAGHDADAVGLAELARSSAPEDRQVIAVVSGDLLHVFASHPCATPDERGHSRCGRGCRVLVRAAETLPEEEARLGREISALVSRLGTAAPPQLAEVLRGLHQNRELRVLCLRSVLDPASVQRLRSSIRVQRRTVPKLRACSWWMDLSADAVRDRDSVARLLLAQMLLPQAKAEGLQELQKPGGARERRRTGLKNALGEARTHALRLSGDLMTATALFLLSLVALYVAVVAWLSWAGETPETELGKYATTAADLQYTLSVPLAAVLLSLVLLQRNPAPAAKLAGWCVAAAGAALAVTLWNGHRQEVRFPYLPGSDLKDVLLDLETQPGIHDHPGTAAGVAAVIVLAGLIGIAMWADRRPVSGRSATWALWARTLTVLAVLALLIGPAFDWWPTALLPVETKELW
ncbi:serine/threonine-protein kinase [Streptomyces cahuitamycinicus]|uniref:Protein kinase domain-containing protein n=1 Tax=Streptomyces cahuitamycinicus TaxID=2070367 RepID=A0A2N8TWU5_9ACTN|nr:serine/threonine-protein kinase [Streptomyces cahuitamycinicus]PNG23482.1 hypothetical protein C1J00_03665 [Streptomyces cahuitamycinicus]